MLGHCNRTFGVPDIEMYRQITFDQFRLFLGIDALVIRRNRSMLKNNRYLAYWLSIATVVMQ